jgi:hypothetical protein
MEVDFSAFPCPDPQSGSLVSLKKRVIRIRTASPRAGRLCPPRPRAPCLSKHLLSSAHPLTLISRVTGFQGPAKITVEQAEAVASSLTTVVSAVVGASVATTVMADVQAERSRGTKPLSQRRCLRFHAAPCVLAGGGSSGIRDRGCGRGCGRWQCFGYARVPRVQGDVVCATSHRHT